MTHTQDPLSDLKKVFGASPFLLDLLLWLVFSPSCHDKSPLSSKSASCSHALPKDDEQSEAIFVQALCEGRFCSVKLHFFFLVFSNRFLTTGKISAGKKSSNLLPNQLTEPFFFTS